MKIYKIDVYIFLRRNSIEFFIEFKIPIAIFWITVRVNKDLASTKGRKTQSDGWLVHFEVP